MSFYEHEPPSPLHDTFDLFQGSPSWSPARDGDSVLEDEDLDTEVDHLDVGEIIQALDAPKPPEQGRAVPAVTPTIKKKRAPRGSRAHVVFVPVPVYDHPAFALWPLSVTNAQPVAPKPPPVQPKQAVVKSYADLLVPDYIQKHFEGAQIDSGVLRIVFNFVRPARCQWLSFAVAATDPLWQPRGSHRPPAGHDPRDPPARLPQTEDSQGHWGACR